MYKKGDVLSVFGPLGRGYRLDEASPSVIIGGGLGIAPLLFLAKENFRLKSDCAQDVIILGGRNQAELEPLLNDFQKYGMRVLTATDDGSLGHHGFVTDILEGMDLAAPTRVFSCGPEQMLAKISTICSLKSVECQVSVESVMACGMGACLGCSRPDKNDTYTHVCLNGPVYNGEDLVWKL